MENCVINAKSKRPIRPNVRAAIINTTDWTTAIWKNCRFYLSPGEALMAVMDGEKDKRSKFIDCTVKTLAEACKGSPNLALKARVTASSQDAAAAIDGKPDTAWKPTGDGSHWLQLALPAATLVNTFKIKEAAGSSISRYQIQYWDDQAKKWMSCFNGMTIGQEFVCAIANRTTKGVRLVVMKTTSGSPAVAEFEAYNDVAEWKPVPLLGGR